MNDTSHNVTVPRRRHREAQLNPASTGRRLKRNVRVGERRTTIVLEAYVWDCIDNMLQRENVSLDHFCNYIDSVRIDSSMASSARLVVLAYFRLIEQLNNPPFVDEDIELLRRQGQLRSPEPSTAPLPLLQLAIRRFSQDEARVE
ncbi:ribbon-helix-helix domain-containing protein [Alphaproteobacteria bacterium]|jgi:predicted DNA-binding ribbon-helix-helix protein|nr:ribbon-helix-helix domain-containing protein [Alphaproteobacteria bacterium]NCF49176.1 hypothetical protein [Bacteroidota bacterium]